MDADEAIGRRIEELRNSLSLSQGELSDRLRAAGLNWSQGTLSRVEAGTRPVRLSESFTVAKTLGVEQDALSPARGGLHYVYQQDLDSLIEAQQHLRESRAQVSQAIAASQIMRLAIELSEGRQGPYVVHWLMPSITRWLASHLRATNDDVLGLLGIPKAVIDEHLTRADEDFRSFKQSNFDLDWDGPDYAPNCGELIRSLASASGVDITQLGSKTRRSREFVLHKVHEHLQDAAITCLWSRYFPFVTESPTARDTRAERLATPAVEGIDVTEIDAQSTVPAPSLRVSEANS